MNSLNKIVVIFAALLSVISVSCETQNDESGYIYMTPNSYTFDNDGKEKFAIVVASNLKWTAEPDADWISLVETIEDTLYVAVRPNESTEMRTGSIVFSADGMVSEFKVEQFGSSFRGKFIDFSDMQADMAFSRNGKYAAGMREHRIDEKTLMFTPVIVNLETGEETCLEDVNTYDYSGFRFISDDATKYVMSHSMGSIHDYYVNGEKIDLDLPDQYYYPQYMDMSSDGSIIVGYCKDRTKEGRYTPVKWVNGEPVILELNEKNLFGTPESIGGMARGCSDDGSVIYGSDWSSFGTLVWVDDNLTYAGALPGYNEIVEIDGKSRCSGIIKTAEYNSISKNGKYLAATYRDVDQVKYPCLINTETFEVTVCNDFDGAGISASNDGVLISGTPSLGCKNCYVAFEDNPALVPVSEWFEEKYGVSISDSRFPVVITDDFVVGYKVSTNILTSSIDLTWFYFRSQK